MYYRSEPVFLQRFYAAICVLFFLVGAAYIFRFHAVPMVQSCNVTKFPNRIIPCSVSSCLAKVSHAYARHFVTTLLPLSCRATASSAACRCTWPLSTAL
jgi:hypothetical protein